MTINSGGVRALICALAALVGVACGDGDPVAPGPAPSQEVRENPLITVSEPVPFFSSVPVLDSIAVPDISDADTVAYVSFPPRTSPRADRVTITNRASGFSLTAAVLNGGLDPVPLPGATGDTLEVRLLRGAEQLAVFLPIIPFFRPPRVVRTQPIRGKRDLPLNSNIIIVFSEPVDSTTVTRGGVELLKDDQPVAIDVIVSSDRLSARAVPRAPLEAGTHYEIVVTRSVRDLSGDPLEQEYRSSFSTTGSSATPLRFSSVVAGSRHTCGLTTDSRAYCWGDNLDGQLGDGTTVNAGSPQKVTGGPLFDQLYAGAERSCGITVAGYAYCWGSNGDTQGTGFLGGLIPDDDNGFGDLGEWNYTSPVRISPAHRFLGIGVAGERNCGWTASGANYCWGMLGDSILVADTLVEPEIPSLWLTGDSTWFLAMPSAPVTALGVGDRHTCELDASGRASCHGSNTYGQLGNGTTTIAYDTDPPAPVAGNLTFLAISGGARHTCGVIASGAAYCWGANERGQLGDGSTTGSTVPVPVGGGLTFTSVSAGAAHTCAVTGNGDAYCWGSNVMGQLGDGTIYSSQLVTSPVKVTGGLTFVAVSVGGNHTCGVTTGNTLYCWGDNMYGALGTGYPSSPKGVPVKVALQ